jgi:hypothetical protein
MSHHDSVQSEVEVMDDVVSLPRQLEGVPQGASEALVADVFRKALLTNG